MAKLILVGFFVAYAAVAAAIVLVGKDMVVALSVTFIWWVGWLFWASTLLVRNHWSSYLHFEDQDREMLVLMALWLSVPMLMGGLQWMRGVAIFHYASVYGIPTVSLVQMGAYLPDILASLVLMLFYCCDRAWGRDHEGRRYPEVADLIWRRIIFSGLGLAAATLAATWWL